MENGNNQNDGQAKENTALKDAATKGIATLVGGPAAAKAADAAIKAKNALQLEQKHPVNRIKNAAKKAVKDSV